MDGYEQIYSRMKERYEEKTGAKIDEASDLGIRFSVLASEVYSILCGCEWIKRQMFPDTAVGEALDLHAAERNLKRKAAEKAVGTVEFSTYREAVNNLTIPAGTVVSTNGTEPIRFVTTEKCVIKRGETSAQAPVEAIKAGRDGNAAKGEVTRIISLVAFVDTVTNKSPFIGGADVEDDERLRKRITESLRNISNGANKAYYKQLCLTLDGVGSAGVIPRNRGVSTVDIFLAAQTTTASAQTVEKANELLEQARELNVDVRAFQAKEVSVDLIIYITHDGYHDEDEVERLCRESVAQLVDYAWVGEDIILSEIIARLKRIDGVADVNIPSMFGNRKIPDDSKAVPGTVTIRRKQAEE